MTDAAGFERAAQVREQYEDGIVNKLKISNNIAEAIRLVRYRERMGLTYQEALNEPYEEIERAFLVWELEAIRDRNNNATPK